MKKTLFILTLGLMMAISAKAQIFLEESSNNNRSSYESSEDIGIIPYHGLENDQANYVPTGSGMALLAVLGGAYFLKKKINKNKKKGLK